MNKKGKVFVGISGGVDSSVSAYLLKKQGYDVCGVFIKTWAPDWVPCTWVDEKRDAMRVCASLDIPFYFSDCEEEYKKGVADYMINEYKNGRTPNPDVMCNKEIKFGSFLKSALSQGADFIATGHYARVIKKDNNFELHRGIDEDKDQSYFLWTLTQEQLSRVLFPIGKLKKNEVRKIAKKAGLFTSEKKDSQGICFLGEIDMKEFLRHYIETKKGDVLDTNGSIVGTHEGAWLFTIGERHGFQITKKGIHKPFYVVGKNIDKNVVYVSEDKGINFNTSDRIKISDGNFSNKLKENKNYVCQTRYHGEKLNCKISDSEVLFESKEVKVSFGQSIVFYDDSFCLGGAIIDSYVFNN